jgi:hypothetical protein
LASAAAYNEHRAGNSHGENDELREANLSFHALVNARCREKLHGFSDFNL